jgi:hypothetical protein
MKTCSRCKNTYPKTTEYFSPSGKTSAGNIVLRSRCRSCRRIELQEYTLKNRDKERSRKKAWRQNNVEWQRSYYRRKSNKRRAQKRNNLTQPWKESEVLSIHGTNCYLCNNPIDLNAPRVPGTGDNWQNGLHMDHLIDIQFGGPDILDNIRPSHVLCNLTKRSINNVKY